LINVKNYDKRNDDKAILKARKKRKINQDKKRFSLESLYKPIKANTTNSHISLLFIILIL